MTDTSVPAYRAIADALAHDVKTGTLAPGDRLPTQRELAQLLSVSIGTVTRAYAEAERRGVVSAEVGRGTFVRDLELEGVSGRPQADSERGFIDLSLSYPIESEAPDLAAALRVVADRADVSQLLRYESTRANERFVDAGVTWLRSCGLEVRPDLVSITVGAQHALSVILSAITNPGDLVLADEFTFTGFIRAAQQRSVRLQGIPMDEMGMIPDELRKVCQREEVKALFCVPTIQNPTTAIMPAERRAAVADIAEEFGFFIIEDEPYRFLIPGAPAAISTLVPERTFFVGTLSKALAGGLRIAFVRSPASASEQLKDRIAFTVWSVAPLTAAVAALWIEDGTAFTVAERKRVEAESRQRIAAEVLGDLEFKTQPGSYYIWLKLPDDCPSTEFAYAAQRKGVGVTPSAAFAVGDVAPSNAVRVCVSSAEGRSQLRKGLGILAEMVRHCGFYRAPLV